MTVVAELNSLVMGIPEWLQGMLKDGRYRNTYDMSFEWKIPEPMIRRWLKRRGRPSVGSCVRLAEATGTPLEEVVRMAAANNEAGDVRTVDVTA